MTRENLPEAWETFVGLNDGFNDSQNIGGQKFTD